MWGVWQRRRGTIGLQDRVVLGDERRPLPPLRRFRLNPALFLPAEPVAVSARSATSVIRARPQGRGNTAFRSVMAGNLFAGFGALSPLCMEAGTSLLLLLLLSELSPFHFALMKACHKVGHVLRDQRYFSQTSVVPALVDRQMNRAEHNN